MPGLRTDPGSRLFGAAAPALAAEPVAGCPGGGCSCHCRRDSVRVLSLWQLKHGGRRVSAAGHLSVWQFHDQRNLPSYRRRLPCSTRQRVPGGRTERGAYLPNCVSGVSGCRLRREVYRLHRHRKAGGTDSFDPEPGRGEAGGKSAPVQLSFGWAYTFAGSARWAGWGVSQSLRGEMRSGGLGWWWTSAHRSPYDDSTGATDERIEDCGSGGGRAVRDADSELRRPTLRKEREGVGTQTWFEPTEAGGRG